MGECASDVHGMDSRLQTEADIIRAIGDYSLCGSSIERKNLNIQYLIGVIRRRDEEIMRLKNGS
jgi:hypothetical protein